MKSLLPILTFVMLLSPSLSIAQKFEDQGIFHLKNKSTSTFLAIGEDRHPVSVSSNSGVECRLTFRKNEQNEVLIQYGASYLGAYREGGDGDWKVKFLKNKQEEWFFAEEDGDLVLRHNSTGWYLIMDENNQPAISATKNGSKGAWDVVRASQRENVRYFHNQAEDSTTFYRIEIYFSYREGLDESNVNEGFMTLNSSGDVVLSYDDNSDASYWALIRHGDVTFFKNKKNGEYLNIGEEVNGSYTVITSPKRNRVWFPGCTTKDDWGVKYCGIKTYVGEFETVFAYPANDSGVRTFKPNETFNGTSTHIWAPEILMTNDFLKSWTAIAAKNSNSSTSNTTGGNSNNQVNTKKEKPSIPTGEFVMNNSSASGKLHNSGSTKLEVVFDQGGTQSGSKWRLEKREGNTYRIQNVENERYLGIFGSMVAGSKIIQTKLPGTGCEWYIEITSNGTFRFKNFQNNFYLAISGSSLIQVEDGSSGTEWILK